MVARLGWVSLDLREIAVDVDDVVGGAWLARVRGEGLEKNRWFGYGGKGKRLSLSSEGLWREGCTKSKKMSLLSIISKTLLHPPYVSSTVPFVT